MKLETSTVTKLVLSELERLDPVTIILEDLGPRAGRLTVTCWGQSWTSYWGGMGDRTVAEFVQSCNVDYVLNCLDGGIQSRIFTGGALHTMARKCIVQRRRQGTGRHDWELGELGKGEARDLWERCDRLSDIETTNECWHHNDLLTELFGDEWHYPVGDKALETNHKYLYLVRVVTAVKAGIGLYLEQSSATTPPAA